MRWLPIVGALTHFIAFAASATGQNLESGDKIRVSDAFARVNSPMSKVGSAYMTVSNEGDAEVRMIGAASEIAMRVELHDVEENEDGVVRMIRIDSGINLPPGEAVRFERGGLHLMLMGLDRGLRQGDEFRIALIFENADSVALTVPVDLSR